MGETPINQKIKTAFLNKTQGSGIGYKCRFWSRKKSNKINHLTFNIL
jgi:hypothetical protein